MAKATGKLYYSGCKDCDTLPFFSPCLFEFGLAGKQKVIISSSFLGFAVPVNIKILEPLLPYHCCCITVFSDSVNHILSLYVYKETPISPKHRLQMSLGLPIEFSLMDSFISISQMTTYLWRHLYSTVCPMLSEWYCIIPQEC